MLLTETVVETVSVVKTIDIICNKCGNSLRDESDTDYEGLPKVYLCGGYGSKIGDGVELEFSLCEDCIIELIKTFKHPPYQYDDDQDIV